MIRFFRLFLLIIPLLLAGCGSDKDANTGNLEVQLQLQYQGTPLVMFDRYTYPNGMEFFLTRFSFFMSDLTINDASNNSVNLSEVQFLNLTQSHETAEKAQTGMVISFEDIPVGNYNQLQFAIGVPPALNAMQPKDFTSDHPLSRSGEYWDSWNSYIFSKTEGKIDTDGDGQAELGLAYHIGSDATLRNIDLTKNFSISSGTTTVVNITIEMERMFDDGTTIFDPLETAQIHSLTQLDAANTLADNLKECFQ